MGQRDGVRLALVALRGHRRADLWVNMFWLCHLLMASQSLSKKGAGRIVAAGAFSLTLLLWQFW